MKLLVPADPKVSDEAKLGVELTLFMAALSRLPVPARLKALEAASRALAMWELKEG